MAHRPPSASLSSLRDALLEAMGDADSPALRHTAAHYVAELLVALQSKLGPEQVVIALFPAREASKRSSSKLLQHLVAAAKHVDRRTQCGAYGLEAISLLPGEVSGLESLESLVAGAVKHRDVAARCSLSWEPDAELSALEVFQVVVLCMQTSHGPAGLPAQAWT